MPDGERPSCIRNQFLIWNLRILFQRRSEFDGYLPPGQMRARLAQGLNGTPRMVRVGPSSVKGTRT